MKKVFCIILALFLVVLSGCQTEENPEAKIMVPPALHSNPTVNEPETPASPEFEYVILVDSSAEGMVSIKNEADQAGNKIRFTNASERDFYYLNRTDITTEVENSKINLILPNTNTEVTYTNSFSMPFANSANTYLKKYAYYNEYRAEESKHSLIARYRQSDNELVFFSLAGTRNMSGPLTEQEAKVLADAFVMEKYGSQFFEEYPHYVITHSQNNRRFTLAVVYQKYICGYPTTDEVIVKYNMNGELVALNAMTKGIFEDVESSITAEKIANAESTLLNAISVSWSIYYKELTLDVDGKCYLRAYAKRDNPNLFGEEVVEFYINID